MVQGAWLSLDHRANTARIPSNYIACISAVALLVAHVAAAVVALPSTADRIASNLGSAQSTAACSGQW